MIARVLIGGPPAISILPGQIPAGLARFEDCVRAVLAEYPELRDQEPWVRQRLHGAMSSNEITVHKHPVRIQAEETWPKPPGSAGRQRLQTVNLQLLPLGAALGLFRPGPTAVSVAMPAPAVATPLEGPAPIAIALSPPTLIDFLLRTADGKLTDPELRKLALEHFGKRISVHGLWRPALSAAKGREPEKFRRPGDTDRTLNRK